MVKEGVHDKMSRIATSACLVSTPTLSSASAVRPLLFPSFPIASDYMNE
jgi:hypothetical protein